ncbi:secondary thiamine-phosphate synthase enzyme YjbQ [Aliiglaciecola sp. LCG003]|uniref:secondary thiamine-phosphate synthase enzyme YjbQ n=1 Tax=Aliiglaciecola sp. LCG003 TaxID=3053655 RepID=UPI00257231B0|nr:secondary thiamine-phosphate synthase enzyme YjbQ [Aliiglaciecola sp. LCG003]WJG09779.1 secondary thiamine-phosphate synthase enzyme YjbQ [Aliiglaciecola sp. LCG003]
MWQQKQLRLTARPRGFHLVTNEITKQLPEIREVSVGILHLFIQHTSASLTINENADPTVRQDMESYVNILAPENAEYYLHTLEGSDDLPAHLKASLIGNNLTIPISSGRLALGTWQGIYLGEHRNSAGSRTIIATVNGNE